MRITAPYPNDPERAFDTERQYRRLWELADTLVPQGIALDSWHPSGPTLEAITLNRAFDASGPSAAAVAMADQINPPDQLLRSASISNAQDGPAGRLVKSAHSWDGQFPSLLEASFGSGAPLTSTDQAIALFDAMLRIWQPYAFSLRPYPYRQKQVFADRYGAGWMLFLPFAVTQAQVPEAARVLARKDEDGRAGTLIVSVEDVFDLSNPEHIHTANQIESRLADQDLYPTRKALAALAQR